MEHAILKEDSGSKLSHVAMMMDTPEPVSGEGQPASTLFVAPIATARLVDEVSGAVHTVTGNITTIGRSGVNKISIADRSVSREHCRIERTVNGSGYTIVDLDSTNGTFVNGNRVTRAKLRAGDMVRIGLVDLRFREG